MSCTELTTVNSIKLKKLTRSAPNDPKYKIVFDDSIPDGESMKLKSDVLLMIRFQLKLLVVLQV